MRLSRLILSLLVVSVVAQAQSKKPKKGVSAKSKVAAASKNKSVVAAKPQAALAVKVPVATPVRAVAAMKPQLPAPTAAPVPAANVGSVYAVSDDSKRISFDSSRYWKDSRWYVIGEWITPDTLRWVGGKETKIQFPRSECAVPSSGNTVVRPEDYVVKTVKPGEKRKVLNREILNKSKWVAIEIASDVESENFVVRSPIFKDNPDCKASLSLVYGWKNAATPVKPILFLKPKDYFFGHEITIYVPEKPERANIQLDLYLGYWRGSFPNAALSKNEASEIAAGRKTARSAPSKSISFLPTAVSRGEWLLPFEKRVGLMLSLEQSLLSFGGVSGQPVLISDWFTGAFYQQIIPGMDGLQARLFFKYHEHLADQGTAYDTMAEPNRQAKNLIIGTTLNHYFGRRWLLGADFEYGMPNRMAGRGVTQGILAYYGRVGYRLTTFMLIIAEGGFRNYKAEGYQTEKLLQTNLGIRLEL